MDIRQLRYFAALAQELHFRKAAERLHITQPPLSQAIKQLEADIGTPLFERGRKRQVALTPAGDALFARTHHILKDVEQAKYEALRASLGETGLLTLAHTDDFNASGLSELMHAFHHRYPGAVLRYCQEVSLSMPERLNNGEFDGLFMPSPLPPVLADCAYTALSSSPIVLAVPAQHPLARRKKVKLKDIAHEHHLYASHEIPTAFDRKLSELLTRAGVRITSNIQSLSTAVSLDMVRRGHGVLLSSEGSLVNREGIVMLTLDERGASLERCLVWKKGNANPALKNLLALVEASGV